jgi:hypothetical protein
MARLELLETTGKETKTAGVEGFAARFGFRAGGSKEGLQRRGLRAGGMGGLVQDWTHRMVLVQWCGCRAEGIFLCAGIFSLSSSPSALPPTVSVCGCVCRGEAWDVTPQHRIAPWNRIEIQGRAGQDRAGQNAAESWCEKGLCLHRALQLATPSRLRVEVDLCA